MPKPQTGFAGFPAGKQRLTPIPNTFFSELLPGIDHLDELKVTLYFFWALARKEPHARYLRRAEIAADSLLMAGLRTSGMAPEEALDLALERAVARGALLSAQLRLGEGRESFYWLNTPKGRAAMEAVAQGRWRPTGLEEPLELSVERPNVFTLYEQNIGPLTAMIAETLREAEKTYPSHWIEEAIRIAVENNARKWSYVQAILEDWRVRGKDEREDRSDTEKALRRYLEGESADFFDA